METDKVTLHEEFPDRTILIGSDVPDTISLNLLKFLRSKSTCFAWSHMDMTGISADVITHKLNIDKSFMPVQQKIRKFAPDWLANVVVVQKKNGKWRVCVDYTDLNKACPKDPFSSNTYRCHGRRHSRTRNTDFHGCLQWFQPDQNAPS
ncbi:hypothetical protein RND81_07G035400 [Saponaria officinalis]|uniref:Uncharacterized protein n=1 Tax=Saponaria officinalis TaxID=3572 RepID=A0AAW1JMJ4_SAPOF